jgi:hypothetical protein
LRVFFQRLVWEIFVDEPRLWPGLFAFYGRFLRGFWEKWVLVGGFLRADGGETGGKGGGRVVLSGRAKILHENRIYFFWLRRAEESRFLCDVSDF